MTNQKKFLIRKMKEENIILTLEDLIADSTLHGIPRLVRSHSLLVKLVWTFCFICSSCYCIYLIFMTVNTYLDFGTYIDINYYSEIPAAFPAITICNQNQFQTNISLPLVESTASNSNIPKSLKNVFLIDGLISENENLKKSLSNSFNETLISCRFNNMECTTLDFQWIFVPLQGNCYRFNHDQNSPKKSSTQGKIDGFHVELYIGDPNSVPTFIPTTGFHVFIG